MTDPLDDTQPHAVTPPPADAATTPAGAAPTPSPAAAGPNLTPSPAPAPSGPPLRADPDRPADSGWREPAWFPPRDGGAGDHRRDRRPTMATILVGLAFIAVGAWFFLDRTLGVAMPRIQWSTIWPVLLIVIGGLILLRSLQRRS